MALVTIVVKKPTLLFIACILVVGVANLGIFRKIASYRLRGLGNNKKPIIIKGVQVEHQFELEQNEQVSYPP